ncbi:MAG: hypothetical protein NZM40_07510 [Sphingomonadaceae bacterium]|uniref:hypothetical protein n=1 Tax=Thermaurantiacus sp. TaxID=2820283 RepID=UPI00298EF749|nr:hypothetical protein [Thermaurantiacus sp.]MCS6987258.1 hypothetical protein [Sphingomonadaceae bacterium]MDW8414478.1 hypothetical protein [Thermaurantiacus sp.]
MLRVVLALAQAAIGPVPPDGVEPPPQAALYEGCTRAALGADPALAERFARAWIAERAGGVPARHCLGLALLTQGRHADAAAALAEAARLAERANHPLVPELWGQAGNAALLAGEPGRAAQHFTSAIAAVGAFAPKLEAGLLVDRARALVETGALAEARRDLDRARTLHPTDATAALLSAALARRMGEVGLAQREVAVASALAPSDPDVMLEQGDVAAAAGDLEAARAVWALVAQAHPGTEAARLAAAREAALQASSPK